MSIHKFILIFLPVLSFGQNYNMELLGRLEYDVELSDVWGYVDEFDNEYALIGLNDNFSIVDVTDPANPVEVFRTIGGNSSEWRDVKTFGDHAYVTCECSPGLLIVDLSPLPDTTTLTYTYWTHDSIVFNQAHNLYIDENGIAYIFGAFYSKGGAIMLDLNTDPMNPKPVGVFDGNYLHDGVARGDTLWGAAVNLGVLQVIDVTDKQNPQVLSQWATPSRFTHNIWFSDDNRFVFTTDEVRNGTIASYDAQNILNPIELDEWMVNDTSIIPHNTHYLNEYLITSHYTYGINIIDVRRPNNLIEVGRYDTSPDFIYEGFNGCWGAYPYLPSGNILATDIEEGLYVFKPTYTRGCYLEGSVTDIHTGGPVFFPEIEIIGTDVADDGNIVGDYSIATKNSGNYTVVASAIGYFPDTAYNVNLENGEVTLQDFQLSNWPLGQDPISAQNEITINPNPTTGLLNVKHNGRYQTLHLYSLDGRLLEVHPLNAMSMTIQTNLPGGMYLLVCRGNSSIYSQILSMNE